MLRLLAFGFLGVFAGFQASQGLQSSLNAELGELNLACLCLGGDAPSCFEQRITSMLMVDQHLFTVNLGVA